MRHGGPDRVLALLDAYFDESGHEAHAHSPALVVAGFVGRPRAWDQFETTWRRALTARGVSDFHAADLDGRFGEFKSFDKADRDGLLSDMIRALTGGDLFPFFSITNVEARRDLISRNGIGFAEGAYEQCAYNAMELVLTTYRHMREPGEQVTFYFHQNFEYCGAAARAYEKIGKKHRNVVGGFGMYESAKVVQLHAADFLAHEVTMREKSARANQKSRWFWTELERLFPLPLGIPVASVNKAPLRFPWERGVRR